MLLTPEAPPILDLAPASGPRICRPIDKLGQYAPISERDGEVLRKLLSAKVQTLTPGVPLVEAGEAPPDIHVVLEGWATRTRMASNGRCQIVAFALPGDICELSAFMMREMDSSIVAQTVLKVASISRAAMHELSSAHPHLSQALWWDATSSASTQRHWMLRVCTQNARERIASLICELAARLYVVGLADDAGFDLPLKQADVGGACGLTPEHTNRTLRDLRESGLMTLERGRVQFGDFDALRALGGFDGAYLHFRTLRAARGAAPVPAVAG